MTKIEWTQRPGTKGETWNPIRARNKATGGLGHFCVHVSPGCLNCYAERLQAVFFDNPVKYRAQDRDKVEIELVPEILTKPLRWTKPRTIFVCSMTDLFAEWHSDEMIDQVFAVMALSPRHTFQVLTKRAERMKKYMLAWPDGLAKFHHVGHEARKIEPGLSHGINGWIWQLQKRWPLSNVWMGISAEDQERANQRVPALRDTPASIRFISYEPALSPVDWTEAGAVVEHRHSLEPKVDQIIFGGESVDNKQELRTVDVECAYNTLVQCRAAGISFFMKQLNKRPGRPDPIPADLQIQEFPA